MLLLHHALLPRPMAGAGGFFLVDGWTHGFPGHQHPSKSGGLEGACTLNLPADNGALCSLSYESGERGARNSERGSALRDTQPVSVPHSPLRVPRSELVGSGGNAPLVASSKFCDTGFTGRLLERFPRLVAGVGVAPTEAGLMRPA